MKRIVAALVLYASICMDFWADQIDSIQFIHILFARFTVQIPRRRKTVQFNKVSTFGDTGDDDDDDDGDDDDGHK